MRGPLKLGQIRGKLQKILGDNGLNFIESLDNDFIEIIEENNLGKAGKLQKVRISAIPFDDDNKRFWFLSDLERNDIMGLTTGDKTVEATLLLFSKMEEPSNSVLTVFLFELKSQIKDKVLDDLLDKMANTISRLYLLLCLNANHNTPTFENAVIRFKTIIFFNKKKDSELLKEDKIHQAFANTQKEGIVLCNSILRDEKVPVKFIQTDHNSLESLEVLYDNL